MRLIGMSAFALMFVTPLPAERAQAHTARFDVASIRETRNDGMLARRLPCFLPAVERSGGRVRIQLTQLCGLIRVAYDVGEAQVLDIPENQGIGPTNFFDVEGFVETAIPLSMDTIRLMLQTLLAERFRLRVRREPIEMPVFILVPTEGESNVTNCSDPTATSSYVPGRIVSCTPPLPMARFAQFLTRETGRMVIDRSGRGPTMFELHWLPDAVEAGPESPPPLVTAIREQLGLKLEAQRAPVDSIVVTQALRPSPN